MAYPWRGGRARVLVPVASHPPSLAAPLLRRSFLFQTPCKKDGQDRAQKLKRRQAESESRLPAVDRPLPLHLVEIIPACPARAPCVHPAARRWL